MKIKKYALQHFCMTNHFCWISTTKYYQEYSRKYRQWLKPSSTPLFVQRLVYAANKGNTVVHTDGLWHQNIHVCNNHNDVSQLVPNFKCKKIPKVAADVLLHEPCCWHFGNGRQGIKILHNAFVFIVRRAGLLWSQQDFEWRWSVPLFKCLTVLEFSFILFDLCLLITFFNFIMNYVPIVTFLIFTYHKIWILSIMFCFIWSYWIIYFLACLEVSWRVVS